MLSQNTVKNLSMNDKVAVLSSGGLDSAVMLAQLTQSYREVYPVYVRCGLFWEEQELRFLHRFLCALSEPAIREIHELNFQMDDVYKQGWYAKEKSVPGYYEDDDQWMIPGRNIILIAKTAVWSKVRQIDTIAHGTLISNPFPDATVKFFNGIAQVMSMGLGCSVKILTPLIQHHKSDVILLGRDLPLQLTLSCPCPVGGSHCGVCGKCRERIVAFEEAEVSDPTLYHKRL